MGMISEIAEEQAAKAYKYYFIAGVLFPITIPAYLICVLGLYIYDKYEETRQ